MNGTPTFTRPGATVALKGAQMFPLRGGTTLFPAGSRLVVVADANDRGIVTLATSDGQQIKVKWTSLRKAAAE